MTIAMTPAGMSHLPHPGVAWRALDAGLWVARRDGKHIGSVQPGRRWLATDADGEPIGTFRSFREAQLAVADPASHRAPVRSPGGARAVIAVALLGGGALLASAGWAWTPFIL